MPECERVALFFFSSSDGVGEKRIKAFLSWLGFGEFPPVLRTQFFGRGEDRFWRERERERRWLVRLLVVGGWQQHPNICVKKFSL